MRKLCVISACLLALAAAPYSSAQRGALPSHFAGWTCGASANDARVADTASFTNLKKEAGLATTEFCDYASADNKIHVDLDKYRDPSSAYEVYTALLRPDMQPSTLNRTSAVDGNKIYVLLGSFILQLSPTPTISTEDLVTLVNTVGARSDQTPLPPIRTYLPQGFTDGTQKYALGPNGLRAALEALRQNEYSVLADEAGWNSGAEVMLGEYHRGKDGAVLLLIEYPTPQLAEQHLHHLEQKLSASAKQAGTTIERKASLLSLVLRPSSAAYGASLRSSLNYGTQVTWNEPSHTLTDPPLLSTVSKIIIATMAFMVVAVVLGVAFGGVRVLAKTFFPGKFFDRPEQMDVLQLGLSSKRIDSRDFY
jgi:hypothetical protein